MPRPKWMGYLPKMRNRRCSSCGREYARWLGMFSLSHSIGRGIAYLWTVLVAALIIVGAASLVMWLLRLSDAGVI